MNPVKLDLDRRALLMGETATVIDRANTIAFAAAHAVVLIGDVDPRAKDTVCEIGAGGGESARRTTDVSGSARLRALPAHTAH